MTLNPFKTAKIPEALEGQDAGAAAAVGAAPGTIDIVPKAVSLSPGVSVRFRIVNTTFETGDSWTVSDLAIGTIQDLQNGEAIYTQQALGENIIRFTQSGGTFGTATAVGIPIHDHSSLGAGGPAFGVYGSD